MGEAWRSMAVGLNEFYGETQVALLEGQVLDEERFDAVAPLLDRILEGSEGVRREAEEVLNDLDERGYNLVCNLLLAAMAVDAVVASDLVALDPEAAGNLDGEYSDERPDREDLYAEVARFLLRLRLRSRIFPT